MSATNATSRGHRVSKAVELAAAMDDMPLATVVAAKMAVPMTMMNPNSSNWNSSSRILNVAP